MDEITRKISSNITFVNQQRINDIINKNTSLKNYINVLKTKITNNQEITYCYFENILTQLKNCYQLIVANDIEAPVGNPKIQNLKDLIDAIPAFPVRFFTDWPCVKLEFHTNIMYYELI
jgi:hypothetical protein